LFFCANRYFIAIFFIAEQAKFHLVVINLKRQLFTRWLKPLKYAVVNQLHLIKKAMSKRGVKVERNSVSEQPHELNYEARKEGTTAKKVEAAKKSAGSNQRSAIEKKLNK